MTSEPVTSRQVLEASLDAMRYLQRDALCTSEEIVAALRALRRPAQRTTASAASA